MSSEQPEGAAAWDKRNRSPFKMLLAVGYVCRKCGPQNLELTRRVANNAIMRQILDSAEIHAWRLQTASKSTRRFAAASSRKRRLVVRRLMLESSTMLLSDSSSTAWIPLPDFAQSGIQLLFGKGVGRVCNRLGWGSRAFSFAGALFQDPHLISQVQPLLHARMASR